MKGIGMPMEILVAIFMILVIILVWLTVTGQIGPIGNQQTLNGYMSSCCISYRVGGYCLSPNPDFECTVGADFGGNMTISALASRLGTEVEARCCS